MFDSTAGRLGTVGSVDDDDTWSVPAVIVGGVGMEGGAAVTGAPRSQGFGGEPIVVRVQN